MAPPRSTKLGPGFCVIPEGPRRAALRLRFDAWDVCVGYIRIRIHRRRRGLL